MRFSFLRFYLSVCLCSIFIAISTDPLFSQLDPYHYRVQKYAEGRHASVVSAHPLASQIGIEVLRKGGNAIDAAIAVQLALAVAYPVAGNIGGGGFMLAHFADGTSTFWDFREKAPLLASEKMYEERADTSYRHSQKGAMAVGVPGTISGIFAALSRARLPFHDLIEPAIQLAEKGFAITKKEAQALNKHRKDFLQFNHAPIAFLRADSALWKAGDTLIQKELAQTLRRVRDSGEAGFYAGVTAHYIVAQMRTSGGIISEKDLAKYTTVVRTPIAFSYGKNYRILTAPPPSTGGIVLQQLMRALDLYKDSVPLRFHHPLLMNLMIEMERRAYADKSAYGGDVDFTHFNWKKLTDENYIQSRMQDYRVGKVGSNDKVREGLQESEETTHFNVVDSAGNAVSLTTTLNGAYGSYVVVAGAGFLLNNEMDDFTTLRGKANLYGAVDGKNNIIAPEKRMMSSMSPTMVLKNNQLYLIVGTPGGTTIPTSVFQVITNILALHCPIRKAVNAPRFHFQRVPDTVFVEKNFSTRALRALQKMGYHLKFRTQIGRVELIEISPKGILRTVADKRGDDDAQAY